MNRRRQQAACGTACAVAILAVLSGHRAAIGAARPPAKTHLIYIAGPDENSDGSNFLDSQMRAVASAAKAIGWSTDIYAATNRPTTAAQATRIKKETGLAVQKSTFPEVNARMTALLEALSSGAIYKAGDQILIHIAAHGDLVKASGREHFMIQLADGPSSITNRLNEVIDLAEAKGVKLGLVLDNCYSGSVLKRFVENRPKLNTTCIVSSSESGRVGFFTQKPLLIYTRGNDLESVFLESRRRLRNVPYQPIISTRAGRRTAYDLELIKHSMYLDLDADAAANDRLCTDGRQRLADLFLLARTIDSQSANHQNVFWLSDHVSKLARGLKFSENSPRLIRDDPTMEHERILYDAIYQHYSKELSSEPNPCRDFKL